MRVPFSLGLVTLGLTFLLGLWLTFAPFVVGYQALGTGWSLATRNDLVVAILVIFVALIGIAGYMMQALREALQAARQRQRAEQTRAATAAR